MSDEQPVTPEGQIEPLALREQLLPFLDPDTGLAGAAVDWLQERQISLADLLKAYAGNPPGWLGATWQEDEALREVLALWCQWTQPGTPAPPDPREHGGDVTLLPRYEMVRLCELNWQALCKEVGYSLSHRHDGIPPEERDRFAWLFLEKVAEGAVRSDNPEAQLVIDDQARRAQRFIDRARRQQKSNVLTLFPDVEQVFTERFDEVEIRVPGRGQVCLGERAQTTGPERLQVTRGEARCRIGRQNRTFRAPFVVRAATPFWVIEKTIAAPDWIGPESSPHWGQSQSTMLENLRQASQRIIRDAWSQPPAEPPPARPA